MKADKENIYDLIPDYHHGLLKGDQLKEFEQELETNEELKIELVEFRKFENMYRHIDIETPEPSPALFERILSEIEKDEAQEGTNSVDTAEKKSLISILSDGFSWIKDSVSLPWGLAVVQAVALVVILMPTVDNQEYETLSNSATTQSSALGTRYNIVFNPSSTEADIRKILLAARGTIISGPSPQGKYVIVLPADEHGEKSAEKLRSTGAIVFFEKAY